MLSKVKDLRLSKKIIFYLRYTIIISTDFCYFVNYYLHSISNSNWYVKKLQNIIKKYLNWTPPL